MAESEGKREKMDKQRKGPRGVIALTGAAAVVAIAVNLAVTAIKYHKEKKAKKKGTPPFSKLQIFLLLSVTRKRKRRLSLVHYAVEKLRSFCCYCY